jgi:L-lactate dehydrogenase complex protein LldG
VTTRAEFLARIRGEMARTDGLGPAAAAARPARPRERLDVLRRELSERWPQTLERFRVEFERVAGVFHRVPSAAEVPALLERLCRERGATSVVTWAAPTLGVDPAPSLAAAGLSVIAMPQVTPPETERARLREVIAGADLGVTGVDLAIAETGTLVLRSGAGRPRSTSLLPPCHVAVFDRRVLVETLEQAGLALEAWHDGPAPATRGAVINFITGPSRTADIELTLTRGVHGPGDVHAVFVDGGLPVTPDE